MTTSDIKSGTRAATAVSEKILELIDEGIDPASISIAVSGLGLAMLIQHYGKINGGEIGNGLIEKAKSGELQLFPALKAANINTK